MDTETLLCPARCDFPQENHLVIGLLDLDVEVFDARVQPLHIIKFVVMRGKERLGPLTIFVDVLDDAAGDAHSVKSRRSAPDFIQQDQ